MPDDANPADATTARPTGAPADADATRASGDTRPPADPAGAFDPTAGPDALGRLGHYAVQAVVGRGGFGVVLKAFDERLHRVVAVKVLVPPYSDSPAARARFLAEARAAARVRDDHVVGVHAVADDDAPYPYLVMEFVAGETLQKRLAAGPLPVADVVRVGTEGARGLAAAHKHGLIHRDVKPANVLLDAETGRARLTDFGLARAADTDTGATVTGGVAGTPAYMSPEQARGEKLDHRSDLYSLGSVLYALCTGAAPFRGDTSAAVVHQAATAAPRPVREVNPKVPPWLAAVIARLHAADPAARYGSAREVIAALAAGPAALGPAAEHWRPEWRAPLPQAAPRAGRGWAAPAAVAVLLLAVGVGLFALVRGPADREVALAPPDAGRTDEEQKELDAKRRAEEEAKRKVALSPPPRFNLDPPAPASVRPDLVELLTSPDWEWAAPESLGPGVNTPGPETTPTLTADEREVYFTRDRTIWVARRGTRAEPFGPAEPVFPPGTGGSRKSPTLTGDGLMLVFEKFVSSTAVYASERATREVPFRAEARLPGPVNEPTPATQPVLAADGLTLLASRRGEGVGQLDIVRFARPTRAAPFDAGAVLPPPVNSSGRNTADWVSDDGRVLVRVNPALRVLPLIHVRGSAAEAFGPPLPFDLPHAFRPIFIGNAARPWLSPDGTRVYYHAVGSDGAAGDLDLWVSRRVPKKKSPPLENP